MGKRALVVLSGGQDSTTCLYWALNNFGGPGSVEAVTFDYGQRHRIELDAAATIAQKAGVQATVLPIDTFSAIGGNALTGTENVGTGQVASGILPNTFVPGRNIIFLTFAAAFAYQRGIHDIVTGVAQMDYSGYPDCRRGTIDSLETTLDLAMEYAVTIHTPLMYKTKAETVHLARELGAFDLLAETHTCYNGLFPPCGVCPSCVLRARGFAEAGYEDPLVRRAKAVPNG